MRVAPLTTTAVGLVLTAGAVFALDAASSTVDVHRVVFTVPADIADGSGSDGSGGCSPGAPCMRAPGVPLTARGTSTGSTEASTSNTTPQLPVPGSDPEEIASHQAKPVTGDLGGNSTATSAAPATPPDELQAPAPMVPAPTGAGSNTATGGASTANGGSTGTENLSPNQAMDLVATILGAVSKLITSLLG